MRRASAAQTAVRGTAGAGRSKQGAKRVHARPSSSGHGPRGALDFCEKVRGRIRPRRRTAEAAAGGEEAGESEGQLEIDVGVRHEGDGDAACMGLGGPGAGKDAGWGPKRGVGHGRGWRRLGM
jgi:hypothetical protein